MCGIVGLHLKNPDLDEQLGRLLTPMLVAMSERGPDSAGIAIFDADVPEGTAKWSLRSGAPGYDWDALGDVLRSSLGAAVTVRKVAADAVFEVDAPVDLVAKTLLDSAPGISVVSCGRAVEVFKDVGSPAEICARYGIVKRRGSQGLGHTRMATESAVTTAHSHPFSAGLDVCLVHNGSFSNYASVRRELASAGIVFDTDNDSEVATRYVAHEISRGANLRTALEQMMSALDGFFTLLVATENEFAVVRDAFACKPAVVAETADYVAMASEYRALAMLPGIDSANVFEPMPEEIHIWSR
jgi:amidophosphoribosyltransferase